MTTWLRTLLAMIPYSRPHWSEQKTQQGSVSSIKLPLSLLHLSLLSVSREELRKDKVLATVIWHRYFMAVEEEHHSETCRGNILDCGRHGWESDIKIFFPFKLSLESSSRKVHRSQINEHLSLIDFRICYPPASRSGTNWLPNFLK